MYIWSGFVSCVQCEMPITIECLYKSKKKLNDFRFGKLLFTWIKYIHQQTTAPRTIARGTISFP